MDHRSGLSLSVARGNSYQVWWAPGRVRPHQEEGRNAGAHPERKPIRGSGKTAEFKPATFHGFRNVAEILGTMGEIWGEASVASVVAIGRKRVGWLKQGRFFWSGKTGWKLASLGGFSEEDLGREKCRGVDSPEMAIGCLTPVGTSDETETHQSVS